MSIVIQYGNELPSDRFFTMCKWLREHGNQEKVDWTWYGPRITFEDDELAVVFKLKFGL